MKKGFRIIISFVLLGSLCCSSCNTFDHLMKSNDMNAKLDAALKYYNDKDYYHAQTLFEDLLPFFKGTKTFETIYYDYADCVFNSGEYLVAAYHFKSYYQSLPQSDMAEQCLFMNAKCYYLMSPDPELDQEFTKKALEEFQLFANTYPQSKLVKDANDYMDQLRNKLEIKDYLGAKLYYQTQNYKAAAAAFATLLLNYPDSHHAEEASYLIIKSDYIYAVNSIPARQPERFQQAMQSAISYNKKFPLGEYEKEVNALVSSIQKNLDKIKASSNVKN